MLPFFSGMALCRVLHVYTGVTEGKKKQIWKRKTAFYHTGHSLFF